MSSSIQHHHNLLHSLFSRIVHISFIDLSNERRRKSKDASLCMLCGQFPWLMIVAFQRNSIFCVILTEFHRESIRNIKCIQ